MAKVLVLVEGLTEETFVREILEPHLRPLGVSAIAKLIVTKRKKCGTQFKGGIGSFEQVEGDLRRLLNDTSATMVTTMIDYYALPSDFPGHATCPDGTDPYAKVRHMETALAKTIKHERFVPYFSLHEYEAIIFADPSRCESLFEDKAAIKKLMAISRAYASPEHINDSKDTAPSKRIARAYPNYDKVYHGTLAADAIGLDVIREACRHFSEWLQGMEALR
jgi:hypothetical protein